jgi:hypothetical protein
MVVDVLAEALVELGVNAVVVMVEELEEELDDEDVNCYSERPFVPPHISAMLPAQVMEHLQSVAVVEPAARVLPQ